MCNERYTAIVKQKAISFFFVGSDDNIDMHSLTKRHVEICL